MNILNFFFQRKYFDPFFENLAIQAENKNAVFLSENFLDGFIIILCINNYIYEISYKNKILIYSVFEVNKKAIFRWQNYKSKILSLKNDGQSIYCEHLIQVVVDTVRQITSAYSLTFHQSKDILTFLITDKKDYFKDNFINLPENEKNLWID